MSITSDKIQYVEYKPWMHDQIAELAVMIYGGNFDDRKKYYDHLLCHQYSLKHPPIALVGVSGKDKVMAFRLYVHWPCKKHD